MYSNSSSSSILMAGSALLVAGLGWTLLHSNSKSKPLPNIKDIDDDDDNVDNNNDDYITADDVVRVFDQLFLELQNILAQLMQQVAEIQRHFSEAQVQALLRAELERAMTIRQAAIIEKDFDMDCFEQATWEFVIQEQEPAVIKAVERFQKLWETATGQPVVGWRPGDNTNNTNKDKEIVQVLDPNTLIQVAEVYFTALTNTMKTLVEQYKAQGKNLQDPMVQQALNMEFARIANDAGESALAEITFVPGNNNGVTLAQFEQSVKVHANNPSVGQALGILQMKQQQELMSLGAM